MRRRPNWPAVADLIAVCALAQRFHSLRGLSCIVIFIGFGHPLFPRLVDLLVGRALHMEELSVLANVDVRYQTFLLGPLRRDHLNSKLRPINIVQIDKGAAREGDQSA